MTTTERLSVPLQALQVESNFKLETATDSDIPLADEDIKFIVETIKEYVFAGWNALKIAEELTLDLQTKLKADERDNLADMAEDIQNQIKDFGDHHKFWTLVVNIRSQLLNTLDKEAQR